MAAGDNLRYFYTYLSETQHMHPNPIMFRNTIFIMETAERNAELAKRCSCLQTISIVNSAEVPGPDILSCADVRDVAAAHIAAFEKANAAGRLFVIGTKFTYQDDAVHVVRTKIPQLRNRLQSVCLDLVSS